MTGHPIWYELMTHDPLRVAPFYRAVFGSYQAAFSFNCVLILLAIVATQWFARERRRVERYVASPPTRV